MEHTCGSSPPNASCLWLIMGLWIMETYSDVQCSAVQCSGGVGIVLSGGRHLRLALVRVRE